MHPAQRAAAGTGLLALAWLYPVPASLAVWGGGLEAWQVAFLLVGAGSLVASLGLASLRHVHHQGPRLLAAGLSVAAPALVAVVLLQFTFGVSLYAMAHAAWCLAYLQAAWAAILWALEPGRRRAASVATALQLAGLVSALAAVWVVGLMLADGIPAFLPSPLAAAAGSWLLLRHAPVVARSAADAPAPAAARA